MINKINKDEFQKEVLDSKNLVVVDFFAEWCGPCKMLTPVIESISTKYSSVDFCKVDIDNNQEISNNYKIMSVPTIIFFKNGVEVKKSVGFVNEDELKTMIDNLV